MFIGNIRRERMVHLETDVLDFSDMHINSTTALCPPVVNLDEGGTYHSSAFQRYLYSGYLEIIQEVRRRSQGRELVLVLNGDIVEMDAKARSVQLITKNQADILRMAGDLLDPLLEICSRWYVVRGTEAHTGNSNWAEEILAEDIGATKDTERGTWSHWQLRRVFGGYRYDFAHHIKGNTKQAAVRLAEDTIRNCTRRGEKLPHFVVRAHVHRIFDSGMGYAPLRAVTSPCMEGSTAYIHRLDSQNDLPEFGALYFSGGNVEHLGIEIKPRKWVIG
jgi:hypothetical protein